MGVRKRHGEGVLGTGGNGDGEGGWGRGKEDGEGGNGEWGKEAPLTKIPV